MPYTFGVYSNGEWLSKLSTSSSPAGDPIFEWSIKPHAEFRTLSEARIVADFLSYFYLETYQVFSFVLSPVGTEVYSASPSSKSME